MKMRRLFRIGGNGVNVNVEDAIRERPHAGQPRFFSSFTQSRAEHIGVVFDVAAELHPAIEFAVMREQGVCAVFAQYPRRAGQMAGSLRARMEVVVSVDELFDVFQHLRFVRVGGLMRGEEFQRLLAVHSFSLVRYGELQATWLLDCSVWCGTGSGSDLATRLCGPHEATRSLPLSVLHQTIRFAECRAAF